MGRVSFLLCGILSVLFLTSCGENAENQPAAQPVQASASVSGVSSGSLEPEDTANRETASSGVSPDIQEPEEAANRETTSSRESPDTQKLEDTASQETTSSRVSSDIQEPEDAANRETASSEESSNIQEPKDTSAQETTSSGGSPASEGTETITGTEEKKTMRMKVQAGDTAFSASLEENPAAAAFAELMKNTPVTISMRDYSGFEKVGPLGTSLPASDRQITSQPGDIMLYTGNQIVVFYGTNSWSYTRIGTIEDVTGWAEALGAGDITVTFSITGE